MSAPLLIVVPTREEVGSPPSDSTIPRLEAKSLFPKSPEELKIAEDRAVAMRELHIDAVRR